MTERRFKYLGIGLVCLFIILFLGNPSQNQFKDYIGNPNFEYYSMIYKRTSNWLIFSTYEFSYESPIPKNSRYKDITNPLNNLVGTYTGFFFNFYKKDN
jgi:hypothetical protein